MKKESSLFRRVGFPGLSERPITEPRAVLALLSLTRSRGGLYARKVFVIKQRRRLDSTTGAPKTIQRILMFDDHPESLRQVFGRGSRPKADRPTPQSAGWWEPILGGLLITGALVLIFLPLF
jgi:hypothetical protein